MKRAEVTEKILSAKRLKGLTWEEIAAKIGGASKIIVTAACMGQMKMTKEQATKAAKLFGLGNEEDAAAAGSPLSRFVAPGPADRPADLPLLRAGAGLRLTVDRQEDPKGDRVVVTMNGKFLPYRKW